MSRFGGRDAIGAWVEVKAGELTQANEVRSGGSYLTQSDLRLFFGLGQQDKVDSVTIRWPEGQLQKLSGDAVRLNELNTIRQPSP